MKFIFLTVDYADFADICLSSRPKARPSRAEAEISGYEQREEAHQPDVSAEPVSSEAEWARNGKKGGWSDSANAVRDKLNYDRIFREIPVEFIS